MSGLTKAATAALIVGLTCFGFVEKAAAIGQEEEEGEWAGAVILPAVAGFYSGPGRRGALRPKFWNTQCGREIVSIRLPHNLGPMLIRWSA